MSSIFTASVLATNSSVFQFFCYHYYRSRASYVLNLNDKLIWTRVKPRLISGQSSTWTNYIKYQEKHKAYVHLIHASNFSSPEENSLVRKSRPWLLYLPHLSTSLTAPWMAQLAKWIYYIKSKRLNYHRQPIISWRSQGSISLLLTL